MSLESEILAELRAQTALLERLCQARDRLAPDGLMVKTERDDCGEEKGAEVVITRGEKFLQAIPGFAEDVRRRHEQPPAP